MKFYFHGGNRQGKAGALMEALESRGWHGSTVMNGCDAFFVDVDSEVQYMDKMRSRGKRIFLYPHTARPNFFNDFDGFPIYPHVTAAIVQAEGHIEIMRRIGLGYPLEVVGWYYCPLRPFQPRESCRKVIFAPIHPNSDDSLSDIDKEINRQAFRKLVSLSRSAEIILTVRYVRKLEANGLWKEPGIKYIQADPHIDFNQIDNADVVVSHQTYAHLAIARGVPTVMMGEDVPPRIGCQRKKDFRYANSWDKYKDLLMYPLDILAVEDVRALLHAAISDDSMIADWRARMIGEPFNADHFVSRVESYL